MSLYSRKYNPIPNTSLVPTANVLTFKAGVANQAALPLTGNTEMMHGIANDTGILYVWSIAATSGLLTDWISQGDILDYTWDGLSGKPSSTPTNIDDAVSKRHTQNSDTKLADGTANEVTAVNAKDAVDKKHAQGTDQGLDTGGLNAVTAAQAKAGYTHSGVITGNPHQVSKSDVGLGNVDNKSEATIITDVKADTDVADALSKKHAQGTDQGLDTGGLNATTAAEVKTAVTNSHALHADDQVIPDQLSDLTDDATHRLVTDTEKSTWNGKQDAIGYTPENSANKRTSFQVTPDDTHYPSEKLVKDSLDAKQASLGFTPEDVSNKDTTTTLGTSDTKYPSQKAVKTYVDALGISTNTIRDLALNIMLNAFRIAQVGSLTLLNMVDQFVDEFEDESGVDTVNSVNQHYDSVNDSYNNYALDVETVLLLHLDNNVTDSALTPKTITNNNVTFSTSEKKFGTHGAVFNGSANLVVPDSDDLNFGTGAWTIDFWIKFNSFSGTPIPFSQWLAGGNEVFSQINTTDIYLQYVSGGVTRVNFNVAHGMSTGTWYHIAYIQGWGGVAERVAITVNGSLIGSYATSTGAYPDVGADFYIGSFFNLDQPLNGYIDEFRISKGIARWTENFTPPTVQYPIVGNMELLSLAQTAESAPTSARLVLFEEDVDSTTLNTDIKTYVSRDNGTTYSQVTLEDCGNYVSGAQILQGVVDISAQPSGTNMKYKIETLNSKKLILHGVGISWK